MGIDIGSLFTQCVDLVDFQIVKVQIVHVTHTGKVSIIAAFS